jgi:putative peptidoglycan lipid II flippase
VSEVASGKREAASAFLRQGVLTTVALIAPITLIFIVDAETIVRVLFGRGRFDEAAIAATSQIMRIYALGLPAQALLIFLEKAYLAAERTRLVVMIGLAAGSAQLLFMWIATQTLGWIGGPLGTLVYAFCHLTALLAFASRFFDVPWRDLGIGIARIAVAIAPSLLVLLLPLAEGFLGLVVRASAMGIVYLIVLFSLRERSLFDMVRQSA